MRRNKFIVILFVCFLWRLNAQDQTNVLLPIIPKPVKTIPLQGVFVLSPKTKIVIGKTYPETTVDLFNQYLYQTYHFKLDTTRTLPESNYINFIETAWPDSLAEGYNLKIEPSHISVYSKHKSPGQFYALQTLLQLLPILPAGKALTDKLTLPCVLVKDGPRFQWRGMHLDVCRHFFPVAFIKKYIDLIALYKMNTFHWHLTEDQGWRIEIKKYPKLTQIGAWRQGTMVGPYSDQKFDSIPYGGFYTQDEIEEIVAYAAQRHVTIVPEIEMPGHSVAAIASYPWLSCTGKQINVEKSWGVFEEVYCTKDSTFTFLQDVLDEVMALFPGKFIHIGGDECPKTRWKTCPHCQSLIKRENLKNEHELQSYFIKRIENYVNSKGKQIIGWDEILEGGLAPNAAVMSWQGTEGGVAAAKQKHQVVMSPGSYCYFDHYQSAPNDEPLAIGGYTPLEKVYAYEPVPSELKPEEQSYVLGAQANVWTEYMLNEKQVEYMALPRMAALAEVLWTTPENKNETEFLNRLQKHILLLDKWNVNYAKALYKVEQFVKPSQKTKTILVELKANPVLGSVYYTLDGTEPNLNAKKYETPIEIHHDITLKAVLYQDGIKKGKTAVRNYTVSKATNCKVSLKTPPSQSYKGQGEFTLVNGVAATKPRINDQWLGWNGDDMEAVIELDKEQTVSVITAGFLKEEWNWIYLPKEVELLISKNGFSYTAIGKIDPAYFDQDRFACFRFKPYTVKFVKVIAKNFGKIPSGKPGAGFDSWLFCDEIQIN